MALDTETLLNTLKKEIERADRVALNDLRVRYLGKKGQITTELKALGDLPMAQRREAGDKLNRLRVEAAALIEARFATLEREDTERRLQSEQIDVSLPGRTPFRGGLHPLTLVMRRIRRFFAHAGFTEVAGPEIEDEYHNFTALNIPDDHPARAMHDTFYFGDGRLLRTHTSPVQIRAMNEAQPPLRIIAPGRVYRCDADATHSPMFHQVEGLFVDRHVSFANLKHILHQFLQAFFEDDDLRIRFRPSYFPFTEPSAEVDIHRRARAKTDAEGAGEEAEEDDWLEVMGCGIVHPKVLEAAGYDASIYSAYAFGLGVERLAMLRYGVADLRQFFVNDLQFLKQFEGAS